MHPLLNNLAIFVTWSDESVAVHLTGEESGREKECSSG